jgi:hypothetical protein
MGHGGFVALALHPIVAERLWPVSCGLTMK